MSTQFLKIGKRLSLVFSATMAPNRIISRRKNASRIQVDIIFEIEKPVEKMKKKRKQKLERVKPSRKNQKINCLCKIQLRYVVNYFLSFLDIWRSCVVDGIIEIGWIS